ncbi:MAG: hypothetical protein ACRDLB_05760 [Actinomycetota bacterium]
MQQVEHDVPKGRFSPVKGFAIVATLAIAGGAFLVLSQAESQPPTAEAANAKPAEAPTEQEAVAIFSELERLLNEVYLSNDLSALDEVAVPGGPAANRIESDFRKLRDANATFRRDFRTKSLVVEITEDNRIKLTQVAVSDGRIIHESGRDITGDRKPQLQTIEWILVRNHELWRIYDSIVTKVEATRSSKN